MAADLLFTGPEGNPGSHSLPKSHPALPGGELTVGDEIVLITDSGRQELAKGDGWWSSLVTFQFSLFVGLILFLLVIFNEKQI